MPVNPFLKQNSKPQEVIKVYVSDRFTDEKGNIVPFEIKIISTKRNNELMEECTLPVIDSKTHRKTGQRLDQELYTKRFIVESIVTPDLNDPDLLESYGVDNAVELLFDSEDFLNAKELSILMNKINDDFSVDVENAIDAETETKNV